ncbi:MAG TPA: hypothetical protein VHJ17_08820 [Thermomonospora sp.]|nr:hypothetical protein [Thermomonospora sp.]
MKLTKGRMRQPAAALTGLGLGLLALGPALAPGFVLSYDMVFVPDPGFTRMTFGLTGTLPRHVPSDAFAAALSLALPDDAAQKLILLAVFVMACVSAASLVPSERLVPRLAAGVCYAWNPFVAERLLLGQWALLLGYAALPWVVYRAARGEWRWLVLALVPAAIGGFAALAVSGLTALVVAVVARRGERLLAVARTAGVVLALSLPWLVTGWLRPSGVPADGAAVEAFAARADTPFGVVGSLLLLGGVWNRETVPLGYGHPVTATAWLLVVLAALAAFALWGRRETWGAGLGAAGAVGLVVAALGAVTPGLLSGLVELWAGFAVLRDGQQYTAPLAVAVAVGLGLLVARMLEGLPVIAAVGVALMPVAFLPSLAWGAGGELRAVQYPDDWARAERIVQADPVPGDVVVLPWAAYRSYPWNHGRRVLDPLPRYLDRRVIFNDAVTVGSTTVPTEDPRARRLGPAIGGGGPLTAVLRAEGVRYVAVDAGTRAFDARRLPGAAPVLRGEDLLLLRIPGPRETADPGPPVAAAWCGWIAALAVIAWSLSVTGITLGSRSPRIRRRKAP